MARCTYPNPKAGILAPVFKVTLHSCNYTMSDKKCNAAAHYQPLQLTVAISTESCWFSGRSRAAPMYTTQQKDGYPPTSTFIFYTQSKTYGSANKSILHLKKKTLTHIVPFQAAHGSWKSSSSLMSQNCSYVCPVLYRNIIFSRRWFLSRAFSLAMSSLSSSTRVPNKFSFNLSRLTDFGITTIPR